MAAASSTYDSIVDSANVTLVSHSVARAALIATQQFFDPTKTFRARTIPECDVSEQLINASMANGLEDATTWNIHDGRISSDVGLPSQWGELIRAPKIVRGL